MMTVKLQIVIGIAILFVFAVLVNMIRRRSLELKYALSWMAVLCALFLFDCAPKLLIVVSDFLGFCFSLVIIFSLTVALSRMSNSIRTLDQMVALNEKRLRELEAELKDAKAVNRQEEE